MTLALELGMKNGRNLSTWKGGKESLRDWYEQDAEVRKAWYKEWRVVCLGQGAQGGEGE